MIFIVFISCTYIRFCNMKLTSSSVVNVCKFDANSWCLFDVYCWHRKYFHFWPIADGQLMSTVDMIGCHAIQHFVPTLRYAFGSRLIVYAYPHTSVVSWTVPGCLGHYRLLYVHMSKTNWWLAVVHLVESLLIVLWCEILVVIVY